MYRVTIKKIDTYTETDTEYKKIADSGNDKDDGAVYGYVEREVTRDSEIEIYDQLVDDLELPEVIKAVNGMDT